jgi:predicted outer membrane protein
MRFSPRTLAVVAAGALLVPAAVTAGPASAHRGHASHGDGHGWKHGWKHSDGRVTAAQLLPKSTQLDRFAIAAGQLAQSDGNSDAVRALGATLVRDHTALLQQSEALAGELGVTLPTALDPWAQRLLDKLEGRSESRKARVAGSRHRGWSGDSFDEKWLKLQEWTQEQALGLHLWAAVRGVEPRLRTLSQGALAPVTAHLAAIEELEETLADDDDGRWSGRHGDDDDDDDDRWSGRHDDDDDDRFDRRDRGDRRGDSGHRSRGRR